jgi:hypothetical protein
MDLAGGQKRGVRWVRGWQGGPRLSTVLKLAAALGLPVGELAGGADSYDDRSSIGMR